MLVYVLSNINQNLGVFSSIVEAQKYYSKMSVFNVKLKEFRLNDPVGKDMTIFLGKKPFEENISFTKNNDHPKLDYYREKFKRDNLDKIDECDNCVGEDCIRNGECCNNNDY